MQTLRIQPDQWTAVGDSLRFAITDIDPAGIRVVLRGQIIGGPEDGGPIHKACEIGVGSEAKIGLVTIALIDTKPAKRDSDPHLSTAKVGVYCPPHLAIRFVKEPT
ncbi:MAG: hypothetical protein JWM57_4051 [Phycisphaerales bacterium]|nr:hypothetical protein [Phycisphaerales bacterium]